MGTVIIPPTLPPLIEGAEGWTAGPNRQEHGCSFVLVMGLEGSLEACLLLASLLPSEVIWCLWASAPEEEPWGWLNLSCPCACSGVLSQVGGVMGRGGQGAGGLFPTLLPGLFSAQGVGSCLVSNPSDLPHGPSFQRTLPLCLLWVSAAAQALFISKRRRDSPRPCRCGETELGFTPRPSPDVI